MAYTKKGLLLLGSMLFTFLLHATNYYIDAVNGNNANGGTSPAAAFRTIQTAVNLTNPGDTVFIMNGTYTATGNVLTISRSGSNGAPVVYTAYPGHSPKLSASVTTFNIISISAGTSYITINGLEVEGYGVNMSLAADTAAAQAQVTCPVAGSPATSETIITKYNGNGIICDSRSLPSGGSHHITITNNKVHDCGGGGIAVIKADYATIESNTVYNCAWYSIFGNSGITFNRFYDYDNNTATYRNYVRNNVCYNNRMYVLWRAVCRITDGNGIIMDIPEPTYTGKTILANNIVYNNGGSGIHSLEMKDIDIFHNMAYLNQQSPGIDQGEIYATYTSNVRIINNVMVANPTERMNGIYNTTNVVYDYNIYSGGTTVDVVGTHSMIRDPQLMNANTDPLLANFRPQSGSVAINNGDNSRSNPFDKDGAARPVNTTVDIGGYESSFSGPFGSRGTAQLKTMGNGQGTGEGSAGYFFGPYESRPNSGNRKSRRAIVYPQALLVANGVPANVILESLQFRRAVQTSTTDITPSTSTIPDNSIIRIYLRNETADNFGTDAFDWATMLPGAASPATLVYAGEASPLVGNSGGWKPVPFQVPFTYTGGHLSVFIEYIQKGSNTNTDINWIYDNGGSQPLYSITAYPNQLYATKSNGTNGALSTSLTTNNERRPVMQLAYYAPALLPVGTLYLTATKKAVAVEVDWLVNNEINNAGFDVQRSSDGVLFETRRFVPTKAPGGNSAMPLQYRFTDEQPLRGTSYYRLLQKDKDGKPGYSRTVVVKNAANNSIDLHLYPNPVGDKLAVVIYSAEAAGSAVLHISDAGGKAVTTVRKVLTAGYNIVDINTAGYTKALYLLQVQMPFGERLTEKFIKK